MTNKYVLDDQGNPVPADDVIEWAKWFERAERRLAYDTVGDVRVSTVFLGIDHNFYGGPPVLWETMVFGGEHDEFQDRYSSQADALAGHARVVRMVQEGQ